MRRLLALGATVLTLGLLGLAAPEPAGAITVPQNQWVPALYRDCTAEVMLGNFGTTGFVQVRTADDDCSRSTGVRVEVWKGGPGSPPAGCTWRTAPGAEPWGCDSWSSGRTRVLQSAVTQSTALGGLVSLCSVNYGCKPTYRVTLYPK